MDNSNQTLIDLDPWADAEPDRGRICVDPEAVPVIAGCLAEPL